MYLWSCQLIIDISLFLAILMLNLGSLTFDSEQILFFVSSYNFYLVLYSSTHHLRTASTLLDLCMIDVNKLICHEQRDICFLSVHDLISINYNIKTELPGALYMFVIFVHLIYRIFPVNCSL